LRIADCDCGLRLRIADWGAAATASVQIFDRQLSIDNLNRHIGSLNREPAIMQIRSRQSAIRNGEGF